ncbi:MULTISPECIES: nucleotidyl transferase AbiEii/AbiGii toxin family protein [Lactobacillaceae]|nr:MULTISPECIES: nucleotidyl transferase AbiEii/AbiGii toxin family protein [Lactobacillaceae]KRK53828.1 hypothetical protein FC22_GL000421 [Lactobacillus johnsonii ATCC 33200]
MADDLLDDNMLRKIILQSLFLEDELAEHLTLKGAHSLSILNVGDRQTRDLDISATLNPKQENLESLFYKALANGFEENDSKLVKFNFSFEPSKQESMMIPNPLNPSEDIIWGGYKIKLGALSLDYYNEKEALQQKKGKDFDPKKYSNNAEIDISFGEYTNGRTTADVEGVSIFVYTPLMTVYEKTRASAQQLEEYSLSRVKTRSRDVYDIYKLLINNDLNIKNDIYKPENIEILKNMFKIKGVDLELLNKIENYKEVLERDFQDNVSKQIPHNELETTTFEYMFQEVNNIFKTLYKVAIKG